MHEWQIILPSPSQTISRSPSPRSYSSRSSEYTDDSQSDDDDDMYSDLDDYSSSGSFYWHKLLDYLSIDLNL